MAQAENKVTYLKDYKQPDYWVKHVDLEIDLQDGQTYVTARLQVQKNGNHNNPLVLDGEKLELLEVKIDGADVAKGATLADGYIVTDETLSLQPADETFVLETKVKIYPEQNTELEGLYKSGGNWCTQCEAQGFRKITYFVDRPDNMATFTTKVIADPAHASALLSNGSLIEEGEMPDGRSYAVWNDPFPKPSYLFAVVGGSNLAVLRDEFTTMSGRKVQLGIYADPKDLGKLGWAMDSLKRSMKWDEEKYGREYNHDSFNIVAVDDFNMGAMENTGLNVFNTKYVLADPRTQTDGEFGGVEGVIAHEYFHNWTGNLVTCRDWYQLCLKEGLTVYRDQEFSADMNSRAVCRISDVIALRGRQFAEDTSPDVHPPRPGSFVTINNFYTATVYEKGAEICRMLNTLLGPDDYRKATDLYFARNEGKAVTVEDWVQCMADASGRDMTQFLKWYTEAGRPTVKASWQHDAATQTFTLTLEQDVPKLPGLSDGEPRHMPVLFGLIGPDGKEVAAEMLELTEQTQTFTFPNVPAGSVPSLFRNFSAPITLEAPYTDGQLRHLMEHDTDGFNRWESGNTFMTRKLLEQIDNYEKNGSVYVSPEVIDVFSSILRQKLDPELKALAMTLPSYSELSQKRKVIDPQAILAVRDAFRKEIADQLLPDFIDVLIEGIDHERPFNLVDAGIRSMLNLTLSYFAKAEPVYGLAAADKQFRKANNMTERFAALQVLLSHEDTGAQSAAIASFYNEFKNDALVVDKWVAAQAAAQGDNILEIVTRLQNHESLANPSPNRMRALYGSFAANPRGFHAADGSGYRFMADFIMDLDAKNPQVAARMVGVFADYKRYKPELSALMLEEIKRIASMPQLSTDIGEKLEKYLGNATYNVYRANAVGGIVPTPSPKIE